MNEKNNSQTQLNKFAKTIAVWLLATLFAYALHMSDLRYENILMVYVVGIVVVILETRTYLWSIFAAALFVFTANYLFIPPVRHFNLSEPNYCISSSIFVIVAIIVNVLMYRLNEMVRISREKAAITAKMYKISGGFLNLSTTAQIISYSERVLADITGRHVRVLTAKQIALSKNKALKYCFNNSMACGFGETMFPEDDFKYLPIKNDSRTIGVVKISMDKGDLTEEVRAVTETVLSQVDLALERDMLNISEEENKVGLEREKLRSNLLRSFSNDLRSPLTDIAGALTAIESKYEESTKDQIRAVLRETARDARRIVTMLENLLKLTKIRRGELNIVMKEEYANEIMAEAAERAAKRKGGRTLSVRKCDGGLTVEADKRLAVQAIGALLDHIFEHSPADDNVILSAGRDKNRVVFEITDDKTEVFDKNDTGLRMTVARAIVEAHNGSVSSEMNLTGGVTVRIAFRAGEGGKAGIVIDNYVPEKTKKADFDDPEEG